MKQLFCIGDSHVSVFLGRDRLAPLFPARGNSTLKNIEVIRLEGILAYNLCEYNRTTKGREKLEDELFNHVPKGAWVLISAGEIDVRVHLIKQAKAQNLSFKEVSAILADRYIGYLNSLTSEYKVLVLLPPPTSFLGEDKIDPAYPRYGSEVERNKMTTILNAAFQAKCRFYGIPYIEIAGLAISDEGLTKRTFLWDGIHLSTYAFPFLIKSIAEKTDLNFRIPISWWLKEWIRRFRKSISATA